MLKNNNYCPVIARSERMTAWADLIHEKYDSMPLDMIFKNLIDTVPALLLPWHADESSLTGLDGWNLATTNLQKRELIKSAVELHAYKGTPWSLREIIRRLGYGEITIVTGLHHLFYDGAVNYDGKYFYGDSAKWSYYRVVLNQPVTNLEATILKQVLRYFAPAHCTLIALDYRAVSLFYDGKANYDGKYNFGEAT